jgi:hypothetical protein
MVLGWPRAFDPPFPVVQLLESLNGYQDASIAGVLQQSRSSMILEDFSVSDIVAQGIHALMA